ncbi:glutathione S-transferase family protein [Phenylobacterium sp.]|uniref:glutathione S-transferase family protein n=1 Tax=Phenylobacterium sp. TaxID=1871053 RepID=UPI0025E2C5C5|nr:glutathione S-transferase family protein [Phenylobacterium sp.]
MKLYCDPISTTSRPILMFIAEQGLDVEIVKVDLLAGGQQAPDYLAINPNGIVPFLVDGDLKLGESAAILRYLAIRTHSTAYPEDLHAQVKVDEAISWFSTQFHEYFCVMVCYPAMGVPHGMPAEQLAQLQAYGREHAPRWLKVLDQHMLADQPYLCGDRISIADYLGLSYVLLGRLVDYDFSPYPNLQAWIARMQSRPSYVPTFAAFDTLIAMARGQQQAA